MHATAGLAISIPLLATGAYAALVAAVPGGVSVIPSLIQIYRARRGIIAKVPQESGDKMVIRGKHLRDARLLPPPTTDSSGWGLLVSHDGGHSELEGTHALRIASKLLARINKIGGSSKSVQHAVDRLEHEGGSEHLFAGIARHPQREPSGFVRWWSGVGPGTIDDPPGTLRSLVVADRLALEMATHEETERRVLEGELSILEAAWREAEEIASIADSLALPPGIDEFLRKRGKV